MVSTDYCIGFVLLYCAYIEQYLLYKFQKRFSPSAASVYDPDIRVALSFTYLPESHCFITASVAYGIQINTLIAPGCQRCGKFLVTIGIIIPVNRGKK